MRKITNILIGESSKTPLRHRMSNAALLINAFYGIITAILNSIIQLPLISIISPFLMFFLFSILYYYSRFKGKAELCVDIAISFTFLVFTPVMWFSNNGLEGGILFFIFLFGAFTLAVVKGKKLFFFLSLLFTVTVSLIIISYLYPDLVTPYKTENDKFIDLFSSFILVFVGILFLMYYYTKQFYKYNEKLTDANTKLEEINIQLSDSVKEREILLQEVHHRVKNNLQMVSGLLRLQCSTSKDTELCKLLKTSQERINTISGVHELLYRSENLKSIDIKEYTESLLANTKTTFNTEKRNIIINNNLEKAIIEIKTIIPYGLIINELISNSLKHAFTDNKGGIINIEGIKENNEYIFSISDNGKGLADNFDIDKLDTLGFKLIQGLTNQIFGEFNLIKAETGVKFSLKFKY